MIHHTEKGRLGITDREAPGPPRQGWELSLGILVAHGHGLLLQFAFKTST